MTNPASTPTLESLLDAYGQSERDFTDAQVRGWVNWPEKQRERDAARAALVAALHAGRDQPASRSELRRIAIQKGEEAPTFERGDVPAKDDGRCRCGHLHQEHGGYSGHDMEGWCTKGRCECKGFVRGGRDPASNDHELWRQAILALPKDAQEALRLLDRWCMVMNSVGEPDLMRELSAIYDETRLWLGRHGGTGASQR